MLFTVEEAQAIREKLEEASRLVNEAGMLVREKDEDGESELYTHIDSDYNNISDTLSTLWRYYVND